MRHFKKQFTIVLGLCGLCLGALGQRINKKSTDLDYFIGQAIRSSPLIKDYGNQLLANKIDSMQLKAGYLPQVTASSTGMYAPIIKGYGYDEVVTNGQSLNALLTMNYSLTGKELKNNQAQAVHLQRDSIKGNFYLKKGAGLDTGYFKGKLGDRQLDILNQLLRRSGIRKLQGWIPDRKVSDVGETNLSISYGGNMLKIKSSYLPYIIHDLLAYVNLLVARLPVVPVEEKFNFKHEGDVQFEY